MVAALRTRLGCIVCPSDLIPGGRSGYYEALPLTFVDFADGTKGIMPKTMSSLLELLELLEKLIGRIAYYF